MGNGIQKLLESIASLSVDSASLIYLYEPEVPEELKEDKDLKDAA
jgi:cyclic lactone autoinducer peptide